MARARVWAAASWLQAVLVAAAVAGVWLAVGPGTGDLPAQLFRTDLFERFGFTVWDGQWYAGHHTPGYSVLFPPLGTLLTARLVGALAAVAAAVLFERLVHFELGPASRAGALWFAAGASSELFANRLTFALGVAVGLGALLALSRRRTAAAVLLAALCALASPLAALFLALAAGAYGLAGQRREGRPPADGHGPGPGAPPARREGIGVAVAALAVVGALVLAFPEGGTEPFPFSALWPIVAFGVVALAVVPKERRAVRLGVALYALGAVVAFAVDSPMGINATRLGTLFAGPVLACLLWRRRALALAVLALPLLYWQWDMPVRDVVAASGDPATKAAYFEPLTRYLAGVRPTGRVEVPLTRNRWETYYVARRFPIARGWERQLDLKYDALFYRARLAPGAYRAWLRANAVEYVALADARLDYAGFTEAELIRGGLPYLQLVARPGRWQVYRVLGATPPVSGPARLLRWNAQSFSVQAAAPGRVAVAVHHTPYWTVTRGNACVEPAGDHVALRVRAPGRIDVVARFGIGGLLRDRPCRP